MRVLKSLTNLLAVLCLLALLPGLALAGVNESRITAISDPMVLEGDAGTTAIQFEITCQCDFAVNATVQWRLDDGSATTADNDYNDDSGVINVVGGTGIETYYVDVTANGDLTQEPDETFTLVLFNASVGSPSFFIDDDTGVATLQNDDINADLTISKSDDVDPAVAGQDSVTYTVTVDNAGPSDANNVVVTDTLPAGVTLVSTTGCAEDPAGVPTCSLGTIVNGGSAQYTVTVSVDSDAAEGPITNSVSVVSDETDPNPGDNSANEQTQVNREADLSISKSDDPDPAVAGENLTYTITVDNTGPSEASGVVVTDTLPAGVTLVSTSGCAEDPAGVPTCTLGTIPAGGNAQYTVTVTVDPDVPNGTVLTNDVSVTANETDPTPGDEATSEGTTVVREVDITLGKTESIDPVVAGSGDDNLTYIVTATNNGPSDVTDLVINDAITLPANVTLDSVTPSAGSWVSPNWTVSIPAGEAETLTIVIDVPLNADEGTNVIMDVATVTGSGGGETFINTGDDAITEATSIRWPEATFDVTKDYTQGDGGPVNVTLNCTDTSGLLVYNPQQGVTPTTLVVRRFDIDPASNGTACTVTEQVPGGFAEFARTDDCDVDPTADNFGGAPYACNITNAPSRATFEVQKRYMDGNDDVPVTLNISCNTGLPLEQSRTVFPDNQGNFGRGQFEVKFVVENYDDGELDCTITEEAAPGYSGSYNCAGNANTTCDVGGPSGIPNDSFFEGPCVFEDITADLASGTEMKCVIRNYPDPVDVVIEKEFVVVGNASGVNTDYDLTLFCDAEILGGIEIGPSKQEAPAGDNGFCGFIVPIQEAGQGIIFAEWCQSFSGDGPDVFDAQVIPEYPYSNCYVVESVYDQAIEVENGCQNLQVSVGNGAECTITNTVFFEGIPTLNQYGLAILALLMLGIGFVGFRRFA